MKYSYVGFIELSRAAFFDSLVNPLSNVPREMSDVSGRLLSMAELNGLPQMSGI
jgi:hypothetical protein